MTDRKPIRFGFAAVSETIRDIGSGLRIEFGEVRKNIRGMFKR